MFKKNNILLNEINFKSNDGTITHHSVISQQDTKGLLIMLPGMASAGDRLMMHLVSSKMIDQGYDIMNLNYSECLNQEGGITENCEKMLEITRNVAMRGISEYRDKKILMFCRDIGGIVGTRLIKQLSLKINRAAVVSPVNEYVESVEVADCKFYLNSEDQFGYFEGYEDFRENNGSGFSFYQNIIRDSELAAYPERRLNLMRDVVHDIVNYLDR